MPFNEYHTYYRIIGRETANKKPLLLLHGGPGSTHNYFEVLDKLATEDGRKLIMYDQIGCGKSYVENRGDLWNMATWIAELMALRQYLKLDELHILGQSWGGMLLLHYLCNHKPAGITSIILSSTLPATWMWRKEQLRLIKSLPEHMQQAINQAMNSGNYQHPAYQIAEAEYMLRYVADKVTAQSPECIRREVIKGRESYLVAWGPNEFTPNGTLQDYDVTDQLSDIIQPALIINGDNDLCTPYIAKYLYDKIPDSTWELFRCCRHVCFIEENKKYLALIKQWLNDND